MTAFEDRNLSFGPFPIPTDYWKGIEVLLVFPWVLPPFTYKGQEFQNAYSRSWVVEYFDYFARTLASFLFNANDILRLWDIVPNAYHLAYEGNLKQALQPTDNVTQIIQIIDVVTIKRFKTLPVRWRNMMGNIMERVFAASVPVLEIAVTVDSNGQEEPPDEGTFPARYPLRSPTGF